MANPIITSAVLDKAIYRPGDVMTLTVLYSDPDQSVVNVAVQVTDSSGNKSAVYNVNAVVDQLTVAVTDSARTWTKKSDTGTAAVYTATA